MNTRITRRLRHLVAVTMPDLTAAQQRRAHRGLKRRWNALPWKARHATITALERAAESRPVVSTESPLAAEETVIASDSRLTEGAKE